MAHAVGAAGAKARADKSVHGQFPVDLDTGAIAPSLNYSIIINSCQISEIEGFSILNISLPNAGEVQNGLILVS